MTIEQTKNIDIVALNEKIGIVYLTIADNIAWGDQEVKLLQLQNKINTYLEFIESGEMFQLYPKSRYLNPMISLISQHPPQEKDITFLNRVTAIIEEAGYSFEWKVFEQVATDIEE